MTDEQIHRIARAISQGTDEVQEILKNSTSPGLLTLSVQLSAIGMIAACIRREFAPPEAGTGHRALPDYRPGDPA